MKRFSGLLLKLVLSAFVFGVALTACEPYQLHALKEVVSTETKNAIDVLPADVSYVGMMNTQALKSNEFTDLFSSKRIVHDNEGMARLQDFIDATGFDPEKDLKDIYVAAGALSREETPEASIVAYASIDQAQLQSYVEERVGDELEVDSYRGIDIFVSSEEAGPNFSITNDNMIIAATSRELLEDMIDRLEGGGASLSSNDKMMKLIAKASSGQSGWLVAKKPDEISFDKPGSGDDEEAELVQSVERIWTALDYVVFTLNIESQELEGDAFFYPTANISADDLSSLMNGVIALAKANPELDEEKLEMLDDIRASSKGDHAHIGVSVDNDFLQTIRDDSH